MKRKRLHVATLIAGILVATAGVPAADADVVQNNVVVILDASGSMGEKMHVSGVRKMEAAKKALLEVYKKVPPDTNIGLLIFSGSNVPNDWAYPLGPRNDAEFTKAVMRPQPSGNTPLGAYIKKGADRLLEQRARQNGYGTFRLLIVTDGQATDPEVMERNTPLVLARGITMDVIGVDMASNHTLAKKVHSYRRADDPQSLARAIADVFAEVAATGSDAVSREAFDQITPIPSEVASAILGALAATDNRPIGPARAPAGVASPSPSAARPQPAMPRPAPTQSAPPFPRTTARQPSHSPLKVILVFFAALVVLATVLAKARHRR